MPHWVPIEYMSQEKYHPFFLKRRETLKSIPKFWPITLLNHPTVAMHTVHHQDQVALSYLEDVWTVRDSKEKRCFTLEFVRHLKLSRNPNRGTHTELQYFKENPFFSDPVLKKEYRYIPPAGASDENKDEWGVTDAQAAFNWDMCVEPQVPGYASTCVR